MTAVPAQRSKAKDPFQLELDREIAKRRSRGLKTGFSDNDDDDDDDEFSERDLANSDDYEEDFDSGSQDNSDDGM